jgi:hypothetical protein
MGKLCLPSGFISETNNLILTKFGIGGFYTRNCQVNLILAHINQNKNLLYTKLTQIELCSWQWPTVQKKKSIHKNIVLI